MKAIVKEMRLLHKKAVKMNSELLEFIDESIRLKLNVSDLYRTFEKEFPDDANFWWRLHLEEEIHVVLMQCVREIYKMSEKFLPDIFLSTIENLKNFNNKIALLITEYRTKIPTREATFNIALEIEESIGEINFQRFMENESNVEIVQIFQKLNKDDKDRDAKLYSYMRKHGIQNNKDLVLS